MSSQPVTTVSVQAKRAQINEILHSLQEKMMPAILTKAPEAEPYVSGILGELALIIAKAEDVVNSSTGWSDKVSAAAAAVASIVNVTEHLCEFTKLSSATKRVVTGEAMVALYDTSTRVMTARRIASSCPSWARTPATPSSVALSVTASRSPSPSGTCSRRARPWTIRRSRK